MNFKYNSYGDRLASVLTEVCVLESYLTGLAVGGSLIVAIGAQNAYVLGQAIRREHHWYSAGICMASDVILFSLGMFGVSAALAALPQALEALRWLGVVFLGWMALQALVRFFRGHSALKTGAVAGRTLRSVVLTTLAVTLLNPHVYLDTLVLIPSVGAQQDSAPGFLAGASSASVFWFCALAWAGSALAPVLSRPAVWRSIDGVIGLVLVMIALQLALGGL